MFILVFVLARSIYVDTHNLLLVSCTCSINIVANFPEGDSGTFTRAILTTPTN